MIDATQPSVYCPQTPPSTDELLALVYGDLRRLADRKLAREKPGQTLQATGLVHEAYLRIVRQNGTHEWENTRHFFSAAAEAMRRILIERARHKASLKCGGDRARLDLARVQPEVTPLACDDVLALDEALRKLESLAPRKARLVTLRFFAGLTLPEAARVLKVSQATVENDWAYARSWLRVEMSGERKS